MRKNMISSQGLKRKLLVAASLMGILPLLVCIYLVSWYMVPKIGWRIDVGLAIGVSALIALVGFFVIKQVFAQFMSVATEAKLIAAGDVNRKVEVDAYNDEVGDLGSALNQLTHRIRSNMDELKSYGDKTAQINFVIQKRVIVLSGLLQISSLISQGENLNDILKLAAEKSRLLASSDVAFLLARESAQDTFSMKAAEGINSQYLFKVALGPKEDLFHLFVRAGKPVILDAKESQKEDLAAAFYEKFRLKNTLSMFY